MKLVVWVLVLALIVLHQDNWYWDDATLVFGFLPIGLFYHALLSLACAVTWYLATKFAWPLEPPEQAAIERAAARDAATKPGPV